MSFPDFVLTPPPSAPVEKVNLVLNRKHVLVGQRYIQPFDQCLGTAGAQKTLKILKRKKKFGCAFYFEFFSFFFHHFHSDLN